MVGPKLIIIETSNRKVILNSLPLSPPSPPTTSRYLVQTRQWRKVLTKGWGLTQAMPSKELRPLSTQVLCISRTIGAKSFKGEKNSLIQADLGHIQAESPC